MANFPISVCTWSLHSANITEICNLLEAFGIDGMHLAIGPAIDGDKEFLKAAQNCGKPITATMIGFPWENYSSLETIKATGGIAPDEHWKEAKARVTKGAKITKKLGVKYMSFHAGFLDHSDPKYAKKFYDRMRILGDIAAANDICILLETGQESGDDLERFMKELNHDHVFLNLDPANLILYNKDEPLKALPKLMPWIRHVHAKDAVRTKVPGTWGMETAWGDGEVNIYAFMKALEENGYVGPLAIEREGGAARVRDIAKAVRRIRAY